MATSGLATPDPRTIARRGTLAAVVVDPTQTIDLIHALVRSGFRVSLRFAMREGEPVCRAAVSRGRWGEGERETTPWLPVGEAVPAAVRLAWDRERREER